MCEHAADSQQLVPIDPWYRSSEAALVPWRWVSALFGAAEPHVRWAARGATVLHIADAQAWARAQDSGVYEVPGGVIHGCSSSQLAMVVAAHFPSREGFVLLSLDESKAVGEVRCVTYRDGGRSETFQHLHGSLPVSAVLDVRPLSEALAGAL